MIGIYKIENLCNHKLYVGQTINYTRRVYLHTHYLSNGRHCNVHLQHAWDTYGSENFKFDLFVDMTEDLSNLSRDAQKKILDEAERFWIKTLKTYDADYGYNISMGGDGATLFGVNNPSYGRHKTPEERQRISETIRINKSHSGRRNGRYGKPVSKETREKISKATKGRQHTQEEKDKRNATMRKLREDPQYISKMRAVAKENGIKCRKYTDEFVRLLRDEYANTDISITNLAKKYEMPRSSCENIIEHYGRFKD